jgi:hypothetical protein
MKGEQVQYLPVVAEDPYSPCALPGLDSWEFFEAIKDGKAVQWRNEVTTRRFISSPFLMLIVVLRCFEPTIQDL